MQRAEGIGRDYNAPPNVHMERCIIMRRFSIIMCRFFSIIIMRWRFIII